MATFYASKTGEVSAREKEHSALVRELAGECMTLLENDGTLPLAGAGKVAVYGNGVRHTVKGGTGSGDVNTRTVVTIEQGLKEAGFEILTGKWLDEYDKVLADAQAAYQAELAKKAEELHVPIFAVMFSEVFAQPDVPVITEKEDTDTAIYVLSRNSGEGADRYNRACDYLLGENELADIAYLAEHYEKTVLILNIANLVDTTELKKIKGLNAILLAGQAGNATGNIVADVVLGKSIPSGKLTDTWAASYEDYPSSKNFSHNNGDTNDEYYSDGIYVGYRYFDTFNVTPNYCFGYGKGYTDFETEVRDVEADAKNVTVTAFDGPNPAGNVGVQINHISPVVKGETVWTIGAEAVLFIGRLMNTGRVDLTRTVAVTGSEVLKPAYCKLQVGALLTNVFKGNVTTDKDLRYISGNVLTGKKVSPNGFLGAFDSQLTVIPEGDEIHEMLGWIMPRFNQFSVNRSYFSWLMGKKEYVIDARIKGGERHMIMSGEYDRVFPMDIFPEYLLKAIIAGDIDRMEALGIYEVAPEDFALCEFVCSSKVEVQRIVRAGLDMLRAEMA